MKKPNQNPHTRKLNEAISKVAMALYKAPRGGSDDEGWLTGNELQEITRLLPSEINDAVKILKEKGHAISLQTYGTVPFDFKVAALSAQGRLELEQKQLQEMPKSAKAEEDHREWDLFICHASEDKEEVVRPLVNALIAAGFSVWYDEFTLTLGDSLRRSIDKGLAQSRYGLVILSQNFFKKNWPQTELDGLAAKERDGKKIILPVWHKINREYVLKFSPTLADRLAVSTEQGIDRVVEEVLKAVEPSKKPQSKKTKETKVESAIGRLDYVINFLRGKNRGSLIEIVKEMGFNDLKQMFLDVLDGIAFFDLPESQTNLGVFDFIQLAILERNRKEGAELFEDLLTWFFHTVTPGCKDIMLEIFARLTRLSHLKEVISSKNLTSSFVAEFGLSNSFDVAGANAEVLQNIQSLLSETDCRKVVDSALSNDQILNSWRANRYLQKVLSSCERKVDPKTRARIEELNKILAELT